MKYIIVVPDGMADLPVPELGGKTPLEAAQTPNMDFMAKHGTVGLVQTIPDGMHPGSDIGNMAILGYNPKECHTGRAPIEAANQGIVLADDEIAIRCNFVTIVDGTMEDYSAGHITTKEAALLIDTLNKQIGFPDAKFVTGKSYRHTCILKMREPKDCFAIKTVPPHDIPGKKVKPYLPQGPQSELFLRLMEKSVSILEHHSVNTVRLDLRENPANMIWLWGQGTKPQLVPFQEKYGISGGIISAVDLVNGLGRLAQLEVVDVPGITGYYDTNYKAKAKYALKTLKKHDFVYVHIEAPDEAGHNGNVKEKVKAIENVDREIVGAFLNHFDEHDDVRMLVLPDHPTPVSLRTHTDAPVGFVMYGKGVARNGASEFNEEVAKEKGLLFKSGEALIDFFIKNYNS